MSTEAAIVHVNVIGFMAAVELARNQALNGVPFVIGAAGAARAVVLDCSPSALSAGIRPGNSLQAARRRLPELRLLAPDAPVYRRVDERLAELAGRYAPLVQNDTGGHLYLDLNGTRRLFGPYIDSAVRLRNEIAEDLGLNSAVALAGNKLVAKVGTRSIRPDGLTVIRAGDEAAFLASQDAGLLPGVGPRLRLVLDRLGLGTIGDLAALSDNEAIVLLGPRGRILREAARGCDDSPLITGQPLDRQTSGWRFFSEARLDDDCLRGALIDLAAELLLELRTSGLAASQACLILRYADGQENRATVLLGQPLRHEADFLPLASKLLSRARRRRLRVAGLGLSLGALSALKGQLDLFEPLADERIERLEAAADQTRRRFGFKALVRGSTLLPRQLYLQT